MNMRTSRSTVTFSHAFVLPGYPEELPAGDYEVVVEEERLQGLSFEAYRRTGIYLMVRGTRGHAGRTELRAITERDLAQALRQGRAEVGTDTHSDAALSPQEDMT